VIVYYSGWLQKGSLSKEGIDFSINDADINGFMTTIYKMGKAKGLDLILHTPGGDIAATESLVEYLRQIFGTNIRAIIPQLAMSCGTMIACSCKEIIMGKHSSIGPIDPQIFGLPAQGILEEFNKARDEILQNQLSAYIWQPIIAKYSPTLIGECDKSITWSEKIVEEWLTTGMFKDEENGVEKAKDVISKLGSHELTKTHNKHISIKQAKDFGLIVSPLESDQLLQDKVLSIHHACIQTLSATPAYKIIENHEGIAFIQSYGRIN